MQFKRSWKSRRFLKLRGSLVQASLTVMIRAEHLMQFVGGGTWLVLSCQLTFFDQWLSSPGTVSRHQCQSCMLWYTMSCHPPPETRSKGTELLPDASGNNTEITQKSFTGSSFSQSISCWNMTVMLTWGHAVQMTATFILELIQVDTLTEESNFCHFLKNSFHSRPSASHPFLCEYLLIQLSLIELVWRS